MIYTVTFNPSLDYIIQVQDFQTGTINKTSYEKILPGGKGINVSIVLSNLGHESKALGFIAGFVGDEIKQRLLEYKCKSDFIQVKEGVSRINVKMKSQNETEINGQGPRISEAELQKLFKQLQQVQEEDILVISGSVPTSLPNDMYEQILASKKQDYKVVVDASGALLLKVLKYHPFLIKPNNHELGDLFDVTLNKRSEVIPYAMKLQAMGARNVLVSMAGEGAVLVDEYGNVYESEACKGEVINSVGAGDSMVAGFIAGYLESNGDYQQAFYKGIASGSASAFSQDLATYEEVEQLLTQINR